MSYCVCMNCKAMVSGYEKYCPACIKKWGLPNEPKFGMKGFPASTKSFDEQRLEELCEDLKQVILKLK